MAVVDSSVEIVAADIREGTVVVDIRAGTVVEVGEEVMEGGSGVVQGPKKKGKGRKK